LVAQELVNGTVEPVAIVFCLVPIREITEAEFQFVALTAHEELIDQLDVPYKCPPFKLMNPWSAGLVATIKILSLAVKFNP
jgi:hypothetical protein